MRGAMHKGGGAISTLKLMSSQSVQNSIQRLRTMDTWRRRDRFNYGNEVRKERIWREVKRAPSLGAHIPLEEWRKKDEQRRDRSDRKRENARPEGRRESLEAAAGATKTGMV